MPIDQSPPHPQTRRTRPPDDPWRQPLGITGTEHHGNVLTLTDLLSQVLDALDQGLLLVSDSHHVLHANSAALSALDDSHPLQLLGSELRARLGQDVVPLHEAIQGAAFRGVRSLLVLGNGTQGCEVMVNPLGLPSTGPGPVGALLALGRCQPGPERDAAPRDNQR